MLDDLDTLRETLRPTADPKQWNGPAAAIRKPPPLPYRLGVKNDLEIEEIAEHDRLDSNPYTRWMPRMTKKDLFAAQVARIDGLRVYLERLINSADEMHAPWCASPSIVILKPHDLIGRKVKIGKWLSGWGDTLLMDNPESRSITENLALWIQIDRYLEETSGQLVAVLDT